MEKTRKEIVYKGDILDVVATQMNLDRDVAEKQYKFMVKTLQKVLWDPEIGSLKLPHLGTLYFRVGKARNYLKVGTPEKNYYKVVKKRVELIAEDREDPKRTNRNNIHLIPPVTMVTNLVGKRSLKEIEEFQNSYYERVKKNKDHSGILYK
jgi:hypothetical protein